MNKTIRRIKGAGGEFIFIYSIIRDISKRNPKKYNIIKNNLRYTKCSKCKEIHFPNYLDESNVSEKEIKVIKKNNFLVMRKINYKKLQRY